MITGYGYFTDPSQREPVFDPGMAAFCPVCTEALSFPVKTISIMVLPQGTSHSDRSYFYRTHKACYDVLSEPEKSQIDGLLINIIVKREGH